MDSMGNDQRTMSGGWPYFRNRLSVVGNKIAICGVGSSLSLGIVFLLFLSGCGSLTGIPAHGGGKRFAVEQELVAAATRATVKKIDLTTIRGKKVNLFVNAIGDTGTGNMFGGRYSLVSQLRGDYIQTPAVTEKSVYPRYTDNINRQLSSQSVTESLLPSPVSKKTTRKKGRRRSPARPGI